MTTLACPRCGADAARFDLRCAACGTPLPEPTEDEWGVVAGGRPGGNGRAAEPAPGTVISHFRLGAMLGRGGMGIVYRALDLELGREVALKFLPGPASGADEARFRREAQAAAALDHPHVGTIHEIGEHQGRRFLALALYEGETLAERLARGPCPPAEAVDVAGQLAAALAAAHRAGVIHRDVKPGNVMITREGQVKLLDFGLALRPGAPGLTRPGAALGTAAYMAPEQWMGGEVDERTDLWAFGVVLYEMLAGRHPFAPQASAGPTLESILTAVPPTLEDLRPKLPEPLLRLLADCLQRDPHRRPDAQGALAALVDCGLGAPASTAGRRGRRPAMALALLAAALGLLGVGVGVGRFVRQSEPPPLYVAVLAPQLSGPAAEAAGSLVGTNLQVAILAALAAVRGLSPLDPGQTSGIAGGATAAARAVAADEVVAARAACGDDLCQVTLARLGRDGAVLWTEALTLPASHTQLFAEAVGSAVRRAYAERGLRRDAPALDVREEDYRRFLDLRRSSTAGEIPMAEAVDQLAALRRRAPALLEAYFLESSLDRRLFEETRDRAYLERGAAVARVAQERAPGDPRPLGNRFDLALAGGDLAEAETALAELERAAPGSVGLPLRQAQLAERRGDAAGAVEKLTAALKSRPSWQLLLVAANLEYRLGRSADARRHLEELLARAPDNPQGLATLAQIELLAGEAERASGLLARLVRQKPAAEPLANLGLALLVSRRHGEAVAVLARALALAPKNPTIALDLADALTLSGRTAEAHRLYRQAVADSAGEIPSAAWPLLSTRAQALAHLGERRAAIAVLESALRDQPDNGQLAHDAALVFSLLGDRSSALYHAERALAAGVGRRWFTLPWFDELRRDPGFAARVQSASSVSRSEFRSDLSKPE